jgi:hypothetical protein
MKKLGYERNARKQKRFGNHPVDQHRALASVITSANYFTREVEASGPVLLLRLQPRSA